MWIWYSVEGPFYPRLFRSRRMCQWRVYSALRLSWRYKKCLQDYKQNHTATTDTVDVHGRNAFHPKKGVRSFQPAQVKFKGRKPRRILPMSTAMRTEKPRMADTSRKGGNARAYHHQSLQTPPFTVTFLESTSRFWSLRTREGKTLIQILRPQGFHTRQHDLFTAKLFLP